jgi:phosphoglycerol transferase MdoB-like AlkP superfamily enzyme
LLNPNHIAIHVSLLNSKRLNMLKLFLVYKPKVKITITKDIKEANVYLETGTQLDLAPEKLSLAGVVFAVEFVLFEFWIPRNPRGLIDDEAALWIVEGTGV